MDQEIIPRAGQSTCAPLSLPPGLVRRVLVVDDDHCIRDLSTDVLMQSGFAVDAAEDGAVAWDALNTRRYDLLITDNDMPRMTGVELLRKLHEACMTLPVIMASGALPEEELGRSPWLQPDATLLKPYSIGEMLRTVEQVLRGTDIHRESSMPGSDALDHP